MVSGQSFGSSLVSLACISSMCSVQCFPGGHSLCSAFGSFFYPHPSPLYSSTVESVSQVPGAIGMGAHGWRARVCQPWGRNSVQGLAVPKVEAPGHPGHPPPLSNAVVKILICTDAGKGDNDNDDNDGNDKNSKDENDKL